MPKISVIMSVYGETIEQLQQSIGSIAWQSFQDFEFIIILDAPERQDIESYIDSLNDDRIIFLKNKTNIGQPASLNTWVDTATSEYIAIMDGDDISDSLRLEKQYTYLEKNTDIDVLFTWWEQVNERQEREQRTPKQKDFERIHHSFFYASPLLHASMMIRKKILTDNPYPRFERGADFALFLELIHKWYRFGVIEQSLYTYFVAEYDTALKYSKIRSFSSIFLAILWNNKTYFWNNMYFWWMFFVTFSQWLLSRNKYIFSLFFNSLQNIYKKIFTSS